MNRINDVLTSLRRVIRATDLHSSHLSKTTGVTAPQILLLQAIRRREGGTLGDLATDISLSQPTVSNILDRLVKRDLVYRRRSTQDKRKVHAYLTDQGAEILHNAPLPLQQQFKRQFESLQDWEQSMIIAALQRVACMMDAQDIDASPILDLGTLDRSGETPDSNEPHDAPTPSNTTATTAKN